MRTAQDILAELNAPDKSPCMEAKRAREIGKSVMETVIEFANEPGLGGGYLLLGADWELDAKGDTRYWPEGVPDPDKIQKDLATQCASMLDMVVHPEMAVEWVDAKTLVVDLCPRQMPAKADLYTCHGAKDLKYLRNQHLSDSIQSCNLVFQYPESPNHALQAYKRGKHA